MKTNPYEQFLGPEDRMAKALKEWLNYQYPKLLWWHTPNEGKRSRFEQYKAKALGIKAGVSDIIMPSPRMAMRYNGLALELKVKPNKCTDSQVAFLDDMEKLGWMCRVAYTFEQAQEIIEEFLNEKA